MVEVVLVDCENVPPRLARDWAARTDVDGYAVELFGRKGQVGSWEKAVAKEGGATARRTVVKEDAPKDAADVMLILRAGEIGCLPPEKRPRKVWIVSRDHIFSQAVAALAAKGVRAEHTDALPVRAEVRILNAAVRDSAGPDGWAPLAAVGNTLKFLGELPPGKLARACAEAGMELRQDGCHVYVRDPADPALPPEPDPGAADEPVAYWAP